MTEPEKDQVTSSTPQDVAADVAATASADDARAAEVVADAEVIEANEAGELDAELEQAAAEAVASAIEESEELAAAKAEAADWQDKYVRLHAEWDTYRRRMTPVRHSTPLSARPWVRWTIRAFPMKRSRRFTNPDTKWVPR